AIWSVVWLSWNALAPKAVRFDPAPAFVMWLFISNLIQIGLMPLIMVGQNLQSRHSELRAQADYEVNVRADKQIDIVLLHVQRVAAQLERQGEVVLAMAKKIDVEPGEPPGPGAA